MNGWPQQSTMTLAALPNAPYWARRHTEDVLMKWGVAGVAMHAELVVTELVTNAARHTGTLDAMEAKKYAVRPQGVAYRQLVDVGTIQLRLSYGPGRLLVEVWDKSAETPVERLPDFVSENGRGLFVVGAFCERWGWYPTEGGGKVVWGEMVKGE